MSTITKQDFTKKPISVVIETHGCKLNQADSQEMRAEFLQQGCELVSIDQRHDIYILNTCTVTHVADAKARQRLRSVRRNNPDAYVVATGCYAERDRQDIMERTEVDLVVGNKGKQFLVKNILDGWDLHLIQEGNTHNDYISDAGRVRSMVKIQEGCNQVCAYCIVPKVRGREKSISPFQLIENIQSLVSKGCREIVLTGTQLGSYGFDLEDFNLIKLIRLILNKTDVERLRVSSIQPQEFSAELIELWDDKRLCPHFHIPMQSGSDKILESMRRRYTSKDYLHTVETVRHAIPRATVTADVIVGFPGESEQDFMDTYELCDSLSLADIHLFRYSKRPGTSAHYFHRQVPEITKRERMDLISTLVENQKKNFWASEVGETHYVLWESSKVRNGDNYWSGLTETYVPVETKTDHSLLNTITPVRLTGVVSNTLEAVVLAY